MIENTLLCRKVNNILFSLGQMKLLDLTEAHLCAHCFHGGHHIEGPLGQTAVLIQMRFQFSHKLTFWSESDS